MSIVVGFFHATVALLAYSGLTKLLQPEWAASALATATGSDRPKAWIPAARMLGAAELGVAGLVFGGLWWDRLTSPAAALVGVFYLAFTAFLVRLRRTDPSAGCGCFGASDTPPGRAHVVLDGAAAAVAAAVTITGATADHAGLGGDALDPSLAVEITLYVALVGLLASLLALGPALWAEVDAAMRPSPAGDVRLFSIGPANRSAGRATTHTRGASTDHGRRKEDR